jgi:hypothetical protein
MILRHKVIDSMPCQGKQDGHQPACQAEGALQQVEADAREQAHRGGEH